MVPFFPLFSLLSLSSNVASSTRTKTHITLVGFHSSRETRAWRLCTRFPSIAVSGLVAESDFRPILSRALNREARSNYAKEKPRRLNLAIFLASTSIPIFIPSDDESLAKFSTWKSRSRRCHRPVKRRWDVCAGCVNIANSTSRRAGFS